MSNSPTFVAKFADGETTRMTTHSRLDKLDVKRGCALARAAYESRTKKPAPAIIEGRFEQEGELLEDYCAAELATAQRRSS